jgi:hypothetical protein
MRGPARDEAAVSGAPAVPPSALRDAVAVVYGNVVCGSLCGGATLRVVRKHPGGWIAAEDLVSVIC